MWSTTPVSPFRSSSPATYYKHPSAAEATRRGAISPDRNKRRLIIGDRPNISNENECGPARKSTKQTSVCLEMRDRGVGAATKALIEKNATTMCACDCSFEALSALSGK